ncbi:putative response regulator in two-component regulatory system [Xenorhabdus bovienii str. Jollieti]|uniref:Putative response regulator in two-component regulatory system n=1 Tax=Xenorhabdus bovienii (strain SS-2004) TaxID=406818 RepID=D3UYZ7_XENBS|nr:two-component system response regulator BtsR [Xenorhabdus bovienii]CBJ79525.1 putative response regulator in two-component regulatory system [Xenorhabdus bovienii SS-2004]CDH27393.1 putative response regulator in two-component regulatory system [Xenorhabdus bovienii str. Jollieti]
MNVLIVDDEPLARENLRYLLEEETDIQIIGECANAVEAIGAIHRLKPDVVFLDIQMPRITGLEMVGLLDPEHRPYIVFLTAFDEYAVQAFEEHAFDYLLKPPEKERLSKTLQRLRSGYQKQNLADLQQEDEPLKYIPCTGHNRIWLMQLDEVLYVTSRLSGVYVMSANKQEGFTELTLRTLETRTSLTRCHRQYLVNMTHLREIIFGENGQAELVLRNNEHIPVSRRYLKPLKEVLGLN